MAKGFVNHEHERSKLVSQIFVFVGIIMVCEYPSGHL
jgi:hypothetical protein